MPVSGPFKPDHYRY
ncbi:MAG: hypothetical protein R3B96_19500 [Pirellulaceae bacterium]